MTELEKLHAGLEYDMWAPEIDALKLRAMTLCRRLNALPKEAKEERTAVMRELFGSVGENAAVMPYFSCDDGKSIFIGKNFLANYNVSILDRAPVRIGDYVMIGPHTLIATVNHPISPMGRRKHLSVAKPVTRCVDRRECDHPARRDHREQCDSSRRHGGDKGCAG